jgi:hypothetical protein
MVASLARYAEAVRLWIEAGSDAAAYKADSERYRELWHQSGKDERLLRARLAAAEGMVEAIRQERARGTTLEYDEHGQRNVIPWWQRVDWESMLAAYDATKEHP